MPVPIWRWISVCLLLVSGGAISDPKSTPLPADDWSVEASRTEGDSLPTLILFRTKHCYYCERLKADILDPLLKRGELRGLVDFRELNIVRGGKIRDFDGEKIRTRLFVKRYGVYATPTLLLVDNQGNRIGTPIVGFNSPEDYFPHLEKLIGSIRAAAQLAGAEEQPRKNPGSS